MNSSLQRAFRLALDEPQAITPVLLESIRGQDPAARIAVYRNNAYSARDATLRSAYPALERLLGGDYFGAVAAQFIRAHPPRSPVLHEYGTEFPEFIAGFTPLQEYAYLADLARLEWARREAFHAADAIPPHFADTSSEPLASLVEQRLGWHPSVRLMKSAHPVLRLWQSQIEDAPVPTSDEWLPVSTLVWRLGWRVELHAMSEAELKLMAFFAPGGDFAEAVQTLPQAPEQLVNSFVTLLRLRCLVAAHPFNPLAEDEP